MLEVLGGLILLTVTAVYCAIVVGKRTDQCITRLLREDAVETPMLVRFPEEVFRRQNCVSGREEASTGKQSA